MTFSLHDYDENFIICLWLLQLLHHSQTQTCIDRQTCHIAGNVIWLCSFGRGTHISFSSSSSSSRTRSIRLWVVSLLLYGVFLSLENMFKVIFSSFFLSWFHIFHFNLIRYSNCIACWRGWSHHMLSSIGIFDDSFLASFGWMHVICFKLQPLGATSPDGWRLVHEHFVCMVL